MNHLEDDPGGQQVALFNDSSPEHEGWGRSGEDAVDDHAEGEVSRFWKSCFILSQIQLETFSSCF